MKYKNEDSISDQTLVAKVLSGNTHAFKFIIKNTEALIAQIVYKMISNVEDRKDIAQDIYLKAFQKLDTFKFQSKLSTWIAQIAYNTCYNFLEKRKLVLIDNDSEKSDDEALELLNKHNNFFSNETEDVFFRKELSEILKTELDKLSPVYKTLITLYHSEELNYTEIAEITKLPEGTVKNYLFRARKTLKENILTTYKNEIS